MRLYGTDLVLDPWKLYAIGVFAIDTLRDTWAAMNFAFALRLALYYLIMYTRTEIKTQSYFTLTPVAWQDISLQRLIFRAFEFNDNVYSGYMGCDYQSTKCDA